jgi:IS5 family transposase
VARGDEAELAAGAARYGSRSAVGTRSSISRHRSESGEHAFRVIKRQFGYLKVRYRGLTKNTAQLHTLFALVTSGWCAGSCSPQVNGAQELRTRR